MAMPYAVADDKMKESPITEQVRTKIQVSGVVVDSNGEPLIGATIREKESGNGTITDVDGKFTLSIIRNYRADCPIIFIHPAV